MTPMTVASRRLQRGSRKHVLDWVEQPGFVQDLLSLARPADCRVTSETRWLPKGHAAPAEARLSTFGRSVIRRPEVWDAVRTWWLPDNGGSNTPNWDIALNCDIDGLPGLILVEAKANVPELSKGGKAVRLDASEKSRGNHTHIDKAIARACAALSAEHPELNLRSTQSYQLANRIAFAWKLASLGVPTVLIYLGFTGDIGIADAGEPLRDEAHWNSLVDDHLHAIGGNSLRECRTPCGDAAFWFLTRARPVIGLSAAR